MKIFKLAQEDQEDQEELTFSLGQTPDEIIEKRIKEQTPNGYPMTIKNKIDWYQIAQIVNQGIDSHLEGFTRSEFDHKTGKILIHPDEMKTFLRRLMEYGSDESISLRMDILSTLGIEEV